MRARCGRTRLHGATGQRQYRQQLSAISSQADQPTIGVSPPSYRICCAGGGIFFYHELGSIQAVHEHIVDVQSCDYVGASAGSLCAVLSKTGVQFEDAIHAAYELSLEADVFDSPTGLAFKWADLIRQWLWHLLPADASEQCRGSVRVLVSRAWPLPVKRLCVDDFSNNHDLVEACLASCHLPCFLTPWPLKRWRDNLCLDGSLFAPSTIVMSDRFVDPSDSLLCINPYDDAYVCERRAQFVQLTTLDGLFKMMHRGYSFTVSQC